MIPISFIIPKTNANITPQTQFETFVADRASKPKKKKRKNENGYIKLKLKSIKWGVKKKVKIQVISQLVN